VSGGPSGWLPIIVTTFGAGIAGSLIATYGGQARARRKARSRVMATLLRLETARLNRPAHDVVDYSDVDMAELQARCVLAGVPNFTVRLYLVTNEDRRYYDPSWKPLPFEGSMRQAQDTLKFALISQSARLLAFTIWHPWLSIPVRRVRARRLSRMRREMAPYAINLEHKDYLTSVAADYREAWRTYQQRLAALAKARQARGDDGNPFTQVDPPAG
jgi:hypothetical protein